jgi:hypothetical protein
VLATTKESKVSRTEFIRDDIKIRRVKEGML